jgi:hypothetical protein
MEASDPVKPYIIDTASGMRLDLDDPRPEDIRIEDVAGGLSKVCRFGAQAREYYSVAQHALLVRRLVVKVGHPELALVALQHDSHEAHLCDIPSPLKRKISAINNAYKRVCDEVGFAMRSILRSPRRSASSGLRRIRPSNGPSRTLTSRPS